MIRRFIFLFGLILLVWPGLCAAQTTSAERGDAAAPDVSNAAVNLRDLSEDDIQIAFRRMKRGAGDIQFDLKTETDIPPPPPGWVAALGRFISAIIDFLMPFFKVLFWLIVAALGALLLYAIGTALWAAYQSRKRGANDVKAAPEYRPSAKQARILLGDADALAAQGKFSEAVHLLLFRSIQDIDLARPGAVRLSMTSREIGLSEGLGPQTRDAFSAIAALVETSYFGSTVLSAADYASARTVYTKFAGLTETADKLHIVAADKEVAA